MAKYKSKIIADYEYKELTQKDEFKQLERIANGEILSDENERELMFEEIASTGVEVCALIYFDDPVKPYYYFYYTPGGEYIGIKLKDLEKMKKPALGKFSELFDRYPIGEAGETFEEDEIEPMVSLSHLESFDIFELSK